VKNLTSIRFNEEEMQILKYGLNYSIENPASTYAAKLIAETERAIILLDVNTYFQSDDTRSCINTCYPPDDEHIVLETCRGM
jgi:hypothetical protein